MAFPVVQFVDQPAASAVVRYDFNQSTATLRTLPLGGDGLDLGNPSYTGEPGGVGGIYGYRSMSLTQRVIGNSKAAALGRMSALAKELLREGNWLRVQLEAGKAAYYFRTYRTEPGAMSLEWSETAGAWDIQVPMEADSFAYGVRETISTATITQAPTGTNPMRLVLPTLKGDAPTALRVKVRAAAEAKAGERWLVGCISGSASMTDTVIDIGTGDTVTSIDGTAAPTADATYFGGSYRTVSWGPVTPTLAPRFRLNTPTSLAPGRYGVWLRCRRVTAAAATLQFRLEQQPFNGSSMGPITSVDFLSTDTKRDFWVPLGDVTLPFGYNAPADVTANMPASTLFFHFGVASGTATINVDAVKLIPFDGPTVTRTTVLNYYQSLTAIGVSAIDHSFDGDDETYWGTFVGSGAYTEIAPELTGGFPAVDPAAAQNVLLLMATDSGKASATGLTYISNLSATATVDVSYYPRYLNVGDGT